MKEEEMKDRFSIRTIPDLVVALLIALAPFLQLYIIPGIGANLLYTLIIVIGGLFAFVVLVFKRKECDLRSMLWGMIIIMFAYCIFNMLFFNDRYVYDNSITNPTTICSNFLVLIICIIVFSKKGTRRICFEMIEKVAIVMSFVVIIQSGIYYVSGTTITQDRAFLLPFQSYLTDGAKDYISTGRWIFGSLFRPSAFFLEPAHFSQYCSIGLAYSLWKENRILGLKPIIITVGLVLTTSGLGIFCVGLIWIIKAFINSEKFTNKKILRMIIITVLIVLVFVAMLFVSDSFRGSISRITVASGGYNSAIEGRLWSREFLYNLKGDELAFGMGYKNIPTYGVNNTQYYMTGIIELLYCQGVIGFSIFIIFYVALIAKSIKTKAYLAFYVLLIYLPFFVGGANLGVLTLIQYIPFLYLKKEQLLKFRFL